LNAAIEGVFEIDSDSGYGCGSPEPKTIEETSKEFFGEKAQALADSTTKSTDEILDNVVVVNAHEDGDIDVSISNADKLPDDDLYADQPPEKNEEGQHSKKNKEKKSKKPRNVEEEIVADIRQKSKEDNNPVWTMLTADGKWVSFDINNIPIGELPQETYERDPSIFSPADSFTVAMDKAPPSARVTVVLGKKNRCRERGCSTCRLLEQTDKDLSDISDDEINSKKHDENRPDKLDSNKPPGHTPRRDGNVAGGSDEVQDADRREVIQAILQNAIKNLIRRGAQQARDESGPPAPHPAKRCRSSSPERREDEDSNQGAPEFITTGPYSTFGPKHHRVGITIRSDYSAYEKDSITTGKPNKNKLDEFVIETTDDDDFYNQATFYRYVISLARQRLVDRFPINLLTSAGVKIKLQCHSGEYKGKQYLDPSHKVVMSWKTMTKEDGIRDHPVPFYEPDDVWRSKPMYVIRLDWTMEYETPYLKNIKLVPMPEGSVIHKLREMRKRQLPKSQKSESEIKKQLYALYSAYVEDLDNKDLIRDICEDTPVPAEYLKPLTEDAPYHPADGIPTINNQKMFHKKEVMEKIFNEDNKKKVVKPNEAAPVATTLQPEARAAPIEKFQPILSKSQKRKLKKAKLAKENDEIIKASKEKEIKKEVKKEKQVKIETPVKTQNKFDPLKNLNDEKGQKSKESEPYKTPRKRLTEEYQKKETPTMDDNYYVRPTYCYYCMASSSTCPCSAKMIIERNEKFRNMKPQHSYRSPCEYMHSSFRARMACDDHRHLTGAYPFYKSLSLRRLERIEAKRKDDESQNRQNERSRSHPSRSSTPRPIPSRRSSRSPIDWRTRRRDTEQFENYQQKQDYERRKRWRSESTEKKKKYTY